MAVTGKWFLSYVSFGSIPGIAVNLKNGCRSDRTSHGCVATYILGKL